MSDSAEEMLTPRGQLPRRRGPIRLVDDATDDPSIPVLLRLPLAAEGPAPTSPRQRSHSSAEEVPPQPPAPHESSSRARRRGSEPPPLPAQIHHWLRISGVILASLLALGGAYYYFTRPAKNPAATDIAQAEGEPEIPVITPPEPAPLRKSEPAPLSPRIADTRPTPAGPAAKPPTPANPPAAQPQPSPAPAPQPLKPNPQPAPNSAPPKPAEGAKPAPANPPPANPHPPAPPPGPAPANPPLPQPPPAHPAPAPPAPNPSVPRPPALASPPLPVVIERNTPVQVPGPVIIVNPTMRAERPVDPGLRTATAAPVFQGPTYPRTDPRTYWYRDTVPQVASPPVSGPPPANRPAAPPGPAAGTAELGPMIDSPPLRSR